MRVFRFRFPRLIFPILLGVTCLHSQELLDDLDAILGKILETNGGEQAIERARSLVVNGKIENPQATYDFVLMKKRPEMTRISVLYKGRTIDTGFDGENAWRRVQVGLESEVEPLTTTDIQRVIGETDFDGPLIGPVPPGTTRTLLEPERIDRVDYYRIHVESDIRNSIHYIDSRTFRELKTVTYLSDGSPMVSLFSDYFRVGQIWMAAEIRREEDGNWINTIHIEDAELNSGLFDHVFEYPEGTRPQ